MEQEEAFHTLKENLCNAPILSLPDGAKDFIVYCDASNQGLGCMLMQRGKVIAYASWKLKIHEKNYTTHDLELGAVHIFDQKELNMRQRRWIELFSDYDYEIRYHLGKANVAADALRRERTSRNVAWLGSDKIWVPLIRDVRTMIMDEAHATRYSIHPGADKMYFDLRDMYWWPDGQSERTIQTLKDMLRVPMIDFGGSWDTHLPLAEFSCNNSYHSSNRYAPFEALYGRKCRSSVF
ncbi:putative reverse transcriptase domain-containing protein [Tanacetum coccineum]